MSPRQPVGATLAAGAALLAWSALLTVASTSPVQAQGAAFLPTTNPVARVVQRVAATEVTIDYHRPRMRGRQIFGALVPWGQVWRTGADNATRIAFSTSVRLGGVALPAGTYELFSIPGEQEWTLILQPHRGQWGSYAYDPARDAARITTPRVALAQAVESFTLALEDVAPASATLALMWERSRLAIPLEIDVRATAVPVVEAALDTASRKPYFLAAMFYFEHDLDLRRAAELMSRAVQEQPQHIGMLHRQALILERLGDREGAARAARQSLAGAARAGTELRDEYTRLNQALLQRLERRLEQP